MKGQNFDLTLLIIVKQKISRSFKTAVWLNSLTNKTNERRKSKLTDLDWITISTSVNFCFISFRTDGNYFCHHSFFHDLSGNKFWTYVLFCRWNWWHANWLSMLQSLPLLFTHLVDSYQTADEVKTDCRQASVPLQFKIQSWNRVLKIKIAILYIQM